MNAREDEKRYLAREIHDTTGQQLIYIKQKLDLLKESELSEFTAQSLQELRGLSRKLHPFVLEKHGLKIAIENLIKEVDENSDLFVESDIHDVFQGFEAHHKLHIYRIIQEALTNILKHSKATSIHFTVKKAGKNVNILLEDNGCGFDIAKGGNLFDSFGLKSIHERCEIIGGKLEIDTKINSGTKLILNIPSKA